MAGENLQVTYQTLETAARKSDDTAQAFMDQLNALESQVKAMVWQGQSGTAFQGYFDTTKRQLQPVQDTLHQLAAQIRGAAQKLQESDSSVASAFRQ
jgi:WXG100 family type VII secretion target